MSEQTPTTRTIVVVYVDLSVDFVGAPPVLAEPFGNHANMLRATCERAARSGDALFVVYPDVAANRKVPDLVAGVAQCIAADPTQPPPLCVLHALTTVDAAAALLVDPNAPFVSPSVLRSLVESHRRSTNADVTYCPTIPRGVGGIVVRRKVLERIATSFVAHAKYNWEATWLDVITSMRDVLVLDLMPAPRDKECLATTLIVESRAAVAQLEPLAFASSTDDDHDAVYRAACTYEWGRWARPRNRQNATTRKPKIAFAHYTTRQNVGSTSAFRALIEGWDWQRTDGVVFLPHESNLSTVFTDIGVRVRVVPAGWYVNERRTQPGHRMADWIVDATAALEEEKPDLLFCSGSLPGLAVAAWQLRIPCVCHLQTPAVHEDKPLTTQEVAGGALLPAYDVVIATSPWYGKALQHLFRAPLGCIRTVSCGVDLQRFSKPIDRSAARTRFDLGSDDRVVLMAGTLGQWKRTEVAVRALPSLLHVEPRAILAILGTGKDGSDSYRGYLMQIATQLGVSTRVRFLGHIEDPECAYAAADVLVHCNLTEPFGLVLVEAMAMGLPVVAPRRCGPGDIVEHGRSGLLLDDPIPEEFGRALASVLTLPPEKLAAMRDAARQRAAQFGVDAYVSGIEEICYSLL